MAISGFENIVTSGLVFYLDATDRNSYISGSTTWNNLALGNTSGSLINGPSFNLESGGNILFDGTNDYISTNITSLRSLTGNRSTLIMWFRTANSSVRQALLADWTSAGTDETVRIELTGFLMTSNRVGGTINAQLGTNPVQSTTFIQNNQWYHVAILYDGSFMRLYLNGVLESSLAATERGSNGTGNTAIGRGGDSNASYVTGSISNVQVYNRALSATEIFQNYSTQKSKFGL